MKVNFFPSGTGKSLTSSEVCSKTSFTHVDINLLSKENDLYDGWDEQYKCPILDEDKVISTGGEQIKWILWCSTKVMYKLRGATF